MTWFGSDMSLFGNAMWQLRIEIRYMSITRPRLRTTFLICFPSKQNATTQIPLPATCLTTLNGIARFEFATPRRPSNRNPLCHPRTSPPPLKHIATPSATAIAPFQFLVRHTKERVQGNQQAPVSKASLPIPPPPPVPPPPTPTSNPLFVEPPTYRNPRRWPSRSTSPLPVQSSAQSSTSFGVYVDISPQRAARVVADVGVDNKEAIEKLNCELATIDQQMRKFLDLMVVLEHKIHELRVEQEQALLFVCRIPVVRVRVSFCFVVVFRMCSVYRGVAHVGCSRVCSL